VAQRKGERECGREEKLKKRPKEKKSNGKKVREERPQQKEGTP